MRVDHEHRCRWLCALGGRWSLAFVSDTFGASRKFCKVAVNDDCCRKNMCLLADTRDLRCEGGTGVGCACACLWQLTPAVSGTTSYARNYWLIWHQVLVASRRLNTFKAWLRSAVWSTTLSPITNTEYAFAALTGLKTRSSGRRTQKA